MLTPTRPRPGRRPPERSPRRSRRRSEGPAPQAKSKRLPSPRRLPQTGTPAAGHCGAGRSGPQGVGGEPTPPLADGVDRDASSTAITAFGSLAAAASTMRARSTSRCSDRALATRACRTCRSPRVNRIGSAAEGPGALQGRGVSERTASGEAVMVPLSQHPPPLPSRCLATRRRMRT